MALAGQPDRGAGDIEAGGGEPEPGEVFGVGAEPAAGHDGPFPRAGQVVPLRPVSEQRVGLAAAPRDWDSPGGARGVEAVEPPGGVARGEGG